MTSLTPSKDSSAPPPAAASSADALPVMDKPYVPPPPQGPQALMRALGPGDPFRWLAAGGRDLKAQPGIGFFYGFCFWLMALTLGAVFRTRPEYALSIASGCLLIGPFLTLGLYEVSRRREQGITPQFSASLTCWEPHIRSMGMLVLVLIVLELLWGRASLVVFAVFFNTGMPSTTGVINAVFNPGNWEFLVVYMAVGGIFATLVFSTAVVSIPMILDRDTDAVSASITSIRVERLCDISEADAIAEGVEPILVPPDGGCAPHVEGYCALWGRLHGARINDLYGWLANPWVAAISFTVSARNIDEAEA